MAKLFAILFTCLSLVSSLSNTEAAGCSSFQGDIAVGLPLMLTPEAKRSEAFVLQVGIDDYENVPKLKGCVRDVADMRQVLSERFLVPPTHILALTDGKATHEAI